jgi:2,4-dienoyl-CoA reductase-like NADH-dependent reductase (Old Yellow Enzyme family)
MSLLFEPLQQRSLTLRNRIVVSPMCQYSAVDGVVNDWHRVHLGSRAVGGAGLVIAEASAIEARGRISPTDAGIYSDEQVAAWAPITRFIRQAGAVAGVQLAHAGRKASTSLPWLGNQRVAPEDGGWSDVIAPSAIAFSDRYPQPQAMSLAEIQALPTLFAAAARRAFEAGFELIELHAAHGYLLHQFLSPLSNQRDDEYGGSYDNRVRLVLETVAATRAAWPEHLPLWVRVSATDWADTVGLDGGWDVEQSIELARRLKSLGVDLIDVSTGGLLARAKIPVGPGYQVPFSARIRREAGIATGAVGLITEPRQAEAILQAEEADCVLLARELLRDPYWPYHAAEALGVELQTPNQYLRAW